MAFEVNQLNKGSSVNSLASSQVGSSFSGEGGFIRQIEDRLRARAGNPSNIQETNFRDSSKTENKSQKLGSGISESEVQKIIREFNS